MSSKTVFRAAKFPSVKILKESPNENNYVLLMTHVPHCAVAVFSPPFETVPFMRQVYKIKNFNDVRAFITFLTIQNMTIANQNLIQEEIKRRLNSGNASYHSVQNLLSSRLSKNI
jgi:hypothetical protein